MQRDAAEIFPIRSDIAKSRLVEPDEV